MHESVIYIYIYVCRNTAELSTAVWAHTKVNARAETLYAHLYVNWTGPLSAAVASIRVLPYDIAYYGLIDIFFSKNMDNLRISDI